MAGQTGLLKSFFNDKGLDLRSSDLVRPSEYASDMINSDYRKTGALNKRKGFQGKEASKGGSGLGIFANINLTTGIISEEMVTIDSNLHKLVNYNLTITYTGSESASVNIYLDDSTLTFKIVLKEGLTTIYTKDLGVGINEASSFNVSNLATAIDLLSDFTASYTGTGITPASFLQISRDVSVSSVGTDIPFQEYVQINSPLAAPFATTQANKNNAEFQLASMVNLQNILYVSSGYDYLHKYDGQTFYRAGMPIGIIPTTALGASTGITDTGVNYIQTYVQKDAKGNFIEGNASPVSTPSLNPTNQDIDVTLTNILNTTGFNTACAVVAGLQTGVNQITVDDSSGGSHTMNVGDVAYFYDGVTGDYIERNITAVDITSITVDGAVVNVADNIIISNNLRIAIYRTTASGTAHYLVAEIPNDSFNTNQIHNDTLVSASLGAEYLVPIKSHGLPPKGKYLAVFQNNLISAGDISNVNNISYSDVDNAEYFPEGDNQFLVETDTGDKITGVSTNNNVLFVFKDQSIHMVSGVLATGQFQRDEVAGGDVGCTSHHTVQEVKGKLIFLSKKGVYSLTIGGNEPSELSYRIEPIFRENNSEYNLSKATSVNWFQKDKYIIMLPIEKATVGGSKYTDLNNSITLVYDYAREAWLKWDNLDMQAGVLVYDNELYFSERRLGTVSSDVESIIYKFLDTGDTYDYADHNSSIDWDWKTHWESLEDPDIFKKFLRLKVHSLDASINDFESETFDIDVETQINYNAAESSAFNLNFGSESGWGELEWGAEPWGSERIVQLKSKLKSMKAQSLRIVFSNNSIHENILISGWTLEASFPYKTRIKE